MPEIEIPYGQETIKVQIPDKNLAGIVEPNKVEIGDERKTLYNAINNPIKSRSFNEFLSDAKDVLFIVNDATRPTPTAKILDLIYDEIKEVNIKFIIATGIHRPPIEEEYKFIFGDTYEVFRRKVYAHNARKDEDMTYLGKSKNGTEMYINKLVTEYRNILVIGSVEPHYFAGYTGGRKSFLPGVASYKTIEMNHKLALSDDARSLALDGNPVNEDMVDAMNVLKDLNVFSIQTVLTDNHELYAVIAGDLHKSFDAAIKYAKEVFCVPLKQRGNIVLTAAPYPMDIDLYQSQKALDNGKLALIDNGIIILVSKCRMGIGEDAFLDLLCKADTPQDIFEILDDTKS